MVRLADLPTKCIQYAENIHTYTIHNHMQQRYIMLTSMSYCVCVCVCARALMHTLQSKHIQMSLIVCSFASHSSHRESHLKLDYFTKCVHLSNCGTQIMAAALYLQHGYLYGRRAHSAVFLHHWPLVTQ